MAGVLPSGLPSFAAYTDVDRTSDDLLVYDASAQQLKTRPAGDLYNLTALNTVQVNQLSDLPAPSGGAITLLPATVYRINAVIDLGADKLVMQDGTAIIGETAQGNQITSSAAITIDTTTGAFVTCIIKGPLRISNTNVNGKCVNVKQNVFLIYDGALCRTLTASTQYGIYCEASAAAVAINNYTMIGLGTKFYSYGLAFGGNFTNLQSTALSGEGIVLDGVAGTTAYGTLNFINCIITCTGSGVPLTIRGTAAASTSNVNILDCNLTATTGTAAVFESATGGRFKQVRSTNSDYRNTGGGATKHGLDWTNCWFDVGLISGGQISTAGSGASYAIKANSSQITTILALDDLILSNGATPANLINGFTKKDATINVTSCAGLGNSATTGTLYTTGSPTFAVTTTLADVASASINAVDASSNLERMSTDVTDTRFRLVKSTGNPGIGTLHYTATYTQSLGTQQTTTIQLWRWDNAAGSAAVVPGATTAFTLKTASDSATHTMSIPVEFASGDYFYLRAITTSNQTLTFSTLTLSMSR
jgi:hypothetical protein